MTEHRRSSSPPPSVLVINLDHARTRWASVSRHVHRALGRSVVRIPAVDWHDLPADLKGVSMTPHSRWLALKRSSHGRHRLTHRQMDGLPSVAILLSHVRAWDWILRSREAGALILEDDACFDDVPRIRDVWQSVVVPRLRDENPTGTVWDALVLGHFAVQGPRVYHPVGDRRRLMTVDSFFGAHAYVLTRRGAQILRDNVFPINEQADGLLLTLQQIGALRLYLLPTSLVSQCMDGADRAQTVTHTHVVLPSLDEIVWYRIVTVVLSLTVALLVYRGLVHTCVVDVHD